MDEVAKASHSYGVEGEGKGASEAFFDGFECADTFCGGGIHESALILVMDIISGERSETQGHYQVRVEDCSIIICS